MKTLSVVAFLALAAAQAAPPSQVAPPNPPQPGVVGGAALTPPATLSAAECKCSIEVTVKHAVTGEPIGDVELTLNSTNANTAALIQALQTSTIPPEALQAALAAAPGAGTGTPQAPLTATTDSSGHAVFPNLAEGQYTVLARLDGYFGMSNDQYSTQATASVPVGPPNGRGGTTPVPGVNVIPKQPAQKITLNMIHGSTVAGRIQDANRRPATGIQVGAFRVAYQYGHRILNQAANTVMTDDRGEYRLFWLPPGEYYIRTNPRPAISAGAANYSAPFYYPGTMDAKTATPVVVREGNNLSGIDIGMQAAMGVTVSGTIINTIQGGRPGPNGQINRSVSSVFLVPRNAEIFDNPPLLPNVSGATRTARGGTANDSESGFEIRGVPPGSYDFYPVYSDGSGNVLNSYFTARTPIEVGSENVTGIQSVIKPGSELKVHVTVVGTPPTPARGQPVQQATLTNMRVSMQPKENIPSLARTALSQLNALDADGNITLTNVVDAKFFIQSVTPLPPDAYISELRHDSRSVFDDNVITIGKDSQTTLEIVVSRAGGTIQGTVRDAKNNPVPVQRVMLIPDPPRRQNPLLYKTTASNPMGNFTINGVAPGPYKLYAWDQIPAGAEQDAEFMNAYDALGTHVNVAAGMSLTDIQVTPISVRH